jgi:hypothetical protein
MARIVDFVSRARSQMIIAQGQGNAGRGESGSVGSCTKSPSKAAKPRLRLDTQGEMVTYPAPIIRQSPQPVDSSAQHLNPGRTKDLAVG